MIKKALFSILGLAVILLAYLIIAIELQTPGSDGHYYEWEDATTFRVNKEAPRASFKSYDSIEQAKSGQSPYVHSLNGNWKFHWSNSPYQRPEDFYELDFDDSNWQQIPVPSNWQMHGYGHALYANTHVPWAKSGRMAQLDIHGFPPYISFLSGTNPPYVRKDFNPVGSYRTEFQIPKHWQNKDIYINFAGVKSAFYVWLNGKKVGYSEDSFTAAEFNISPYLQPGNNLLAVEVYRWSDSAYLELQDMWRLSGIFRDVDLIAKSQSSINDFYVKTDLVNDYQDAELTVDVTTIGEHDAYNLSLYLQGHEYSKPTKVSESKVVTNNTRLTASLNDIQLWNSETPNLYDMYLVLEKSGQTEQVAHHKIGFREVEIRNQQLLLNGKTIVFKGVNRHEMAPDVGQAISKQQMEQDIKLLKQFNFNAVRTAHYPNHPYWYELTDKYGIMVIDEANLETHGLRDSMPGSDPTWAGAVVDRMTNMVARDKNHASVVLWSMGNEAGQGDNFWKIKTAAKQLDDTRPIVYEAMPEVSDLVAPMYATYTTKDGTSLAELGADYQQSERSFGMNTVWDYVFDGEEADAGRYIDVWGQNPENDKPLILIEYAHGMGNSNGGFSDYWDVIKQYDNLQGGFIWDWSDQALDAAVKDGEHKGAKYWAYGGDIEPEGFPHDGIFNSNGVTFPDRTPKPALYEIKKVQQWLDFNLIGNSLIVTNNYQYKNLAEFELEVSVLNNGKVLQQGRLPLSIPPQQKGRFDLGLNTQVDGEVLLNLKVKTKRNSDWAAAGHVVASEQLILKSDRFEFSPPAIASSDLITTETKDEIVVENEYMQVTIDKDSGLITEYIYQQHSLITEPLTPNFSRAATDNDNTWGVWQQGASEWHKAYDSRDRTEVLIPEQSPQQVVVTTQFTLQHHDTQGRLRYEISNSGVIGIEFYVDINDKVTDVELARIGLQTQFAKEFDKISWYGRGPFENYIDRNIAADIGIYKQTLSEFYQHYVKPQESSNRTDIRWLALQNQEGKGVLVVPEQAIAFSLWPYSQQEIASRAHPYELNPSKGNTLNLDLIQRGIGGDTGWARGSFANPPYRIVPKEYQYKVNLVPVF